MAVPTAQLPRPAWAASPVLDESWLRLLLLATATFASIAVVFASRRSLPSVTWVLVAAGACGALVLLEQRRPRLPIRLAAAAIGVVMVMAVVTPSRSSNDLWSYTMYGRTVTVHDGSPYQRVPADYPSDPFLARTSPRWRHTGSVYGPLFVGVASAGTLLAGDSALLSRLYFQILAALAVIGILVIVWRRTGSVAAVLWLGLNPVLTVIVVNGGHNDAYTGVALLIAALLITRGRARAAGITIGIAMLIKLSAGLALVGVVLWAWRHRQTRSGLTAVVAATGVVLLGYLPVLAGASGVLAGADKTVTKASAWNVLVDRILHHDAGRNVPNPLAPNTTLTVVFYLSAAAVLLLAVGLGSWAARHRRPEPAMGVAVASYTVAAEYTFPWYAVWGLPLFAERRLSTVGWIVWLQSILMLAALRIPDRVTGNLPHTTVRIALTMIAPLSLLVAFVVAAAKDRVPQSSGNLDAASSGSVRSHES